MTEKVFKVTQEQFDNLHKAVDLARRMGGYTYNDNEGPCCVAAQYVNLLSQADCAELTECYGVLHLRNYPFTRFGDTQDTNPLHHLQGMWDKAASRIERGTSGAFVQMNSYQPEAEVRAGMHKFLDDYCEVVS